jgi:hypothetical protein
MRKRTRSYRSGGSLRCLKLKNQLVSLPSFFLVMTTRLGLDRWAPFE